MGGGMYIHVNVIPIGFLSHDLPIPLTMALPSISTAVLITPAWHANCWASTPLSTEGRRLPYPCGR